MVKPPFDMQKFHRDVSKSIDAISFGFEDPQIWLSTGNYALNYLVSGDFNRGVPLERVTLLAGEPAAGKSLLAAQIIISAQKAGIHTILIDTETALDNSWLIRAGVNISPDYLSQTRLAVVDDVAKYISDFMKIYKKINEGVDIKDMQGILFVIDSLSMLDSRAGISQFEAGDLKGDMGRLPKALKALIKNCLVQFGNYKVGMVATNHVYASQDQYNPDPKISGGLGFMFAASIILQMKALKLKRNEDGEKIKEVRGIRCKCTAVKTRFSKPWDSVEVEIPYEQGVDPYSGLFELAENKGVIVPEGKTQRKYTDKNGVVYKGFKKNLIKNKELLDLIMTEWDDHSLKSTNDS